LAVGSPRRFERATKLTAAAVALTEGVAKVVLSQSLVASFRPKRYYTIPRETMESALEDVEQLINFFVIEFQRVLFAENVLATFAVSSPLPCEILLTRRGSRLSRP
jgi:hypothetical protein